MRAALDGQRAERQCRKRLSGGFCGQQLGVWILPQTKRPEHIPGFAFAVRHQGLEWKRNRRLLYLAEAACATAGLDRQRFIRRGVIASVGPGMTGLRLKPALIAYFLERHRALVDIIWVLRESRAVIENLDPIGDPCFTVLGHRTCESINAVTVNHVV